MCESWLCGDKLTMRGASIVLLLVARPVRATYPVQVEVDVNGIPIVQRKRAPSMQCHDAVPLHSDDAVRRFRKAHSHLMLMAQSKFDGNSNVAGAMFDRAAQQCRIGDGVAFARFDIDDAPRAAETLGAKTENLPRYALLLETLAEPVQYTGGWSQVSIGGWLQQQVALSPVAASSLQDVARLAHSHEGGQVVIVLTSEVQVQHRAEAAAREVAVNAKLVFGGKVLASALGAEVPCILIATCDATEPFAIMHPPLLRAEIADFLRQRALPCVVDVGDTQRSFAKQVRSHPSTMQVILVHRDGASGAHDASANARAQLVHAARKLRGKVLCLAYDFFDNNPDVFARWGVYANDLPAVLVLHSRGSREERRWRMQSLPVSVRRIEDLVHHARREVVHGSTAERAQWDVLEVPIAYAQALNRSQSSI